MQLTATMFIAASLAGCAYVEERFADVTQDPKFQVGFRQGEVYRLRADASLVATVSNGCLPGKAEERLEIWSSDSVARYQSQNYELDIVTAVKAGSLIRVDGLEHNYTFAIPPVPSDAQVLQAYGTVVDGSMVWTHVRVPDDRQAGWSEVESTRIMAYPPDATLLERLPADAFPANARPTTR
jgi:hypothetical protein